MKANNRSLLGMLVIVSILFLSFTTNNCKGVKVKQMTQKESFGTEKYSWVYEFFYNGKEQLTKIVDADQSEVFTLVEYDSQGRLAKEIWVEGKDKDTTYYTWEEKGIMAVDGGDNSRTLFTFNGDNQLTKVEDYYFSGKEWILADYYVNTWENGNLVEQKEYGYFYMYEYTSNIADAPFYSREHRALLKENISHLNEVLAKNVSEMVLKYKTVFTYDLNPNPFCEYKYASIMGAFGSKNNPLTETTMEYSREGAEAGGEVIKYTYTYNADGYPTNVVGQSSDSNHSSSMELVYEGK